MRVFGFVVVSTAVLLSSTATGLAQNTPNVMVMETVPASASDIRGPVHGAPATGHPMNRSNHTSSSNNLQIAGMRPSANQPEPEPDLPAHILKAGDYDAAYSAYVSGQFKRAFELAQKRADIGDPTAMTLIGMLYMEGRVLEKNSEIAADWFKRAADLGDPHAALYYGVNLFNSSTTEEGKETGVTYLKKAADAGIPRANYYYAQILMNLAPEKDKLDIGLVWYLKGAIKGDAYSLYSAAEILAVGSEKVKPDEYAARALLESAANIGHVAAQLELANWMIDGRGGPIDQKGAFTLVKLVAVNNVPVAQVNLARFYFNGVGTEKNPVMGASWYLLAQQGNQGATDLDELMKKLSPEQLKQAKARVDTLLFAP
ncbi:sel1 repeat family protein [Bartonella sp. HY329]|uniref:tetratricopeptide repeat protein n=1 Tax=unclassified Bartonella TaxID=2645622 RepID=UPI0021CAA5DA|nr:MULTISPECIES: tetratricopeptide repeat protein [unclassified Bartonella]UXM96327.1 sel1 repeat family protein [Bartonella sp. HY329]UXN10652.1 sel1 repeat family protein [Bartonella sp. HY328]